MRKVFTYGAAIVLMAAIATAFTNCGQYETAQEEDILSLGTLACDDDCITPNSTNLEVRPNLKFNGTQYMVHSTLSDFNIGGECNEGGYPRNKITWQLYRQNGQLLRSSSNIVIGGVNLDSKCVNGRFSIFVRLREIAGVDNVRRTGLYAEDNVRYPHNLVISIVGEDIPNDPTPATNSIKARATVQLIPDSST